MAVELTSASVVVGRKFTFKSVLDGRSVQDIVDKTYTGGLANGSGANQGQIAFYDERSLLTTTSDELDLTALASAFGVATFAKVKLIAIEITTAASGYRLLIGGAASNAWEAFLGAAGDIVRIDAKGIFALTSPVDGFTVDSSHKVLKINNPSGETLAYTIYIVGTGTVA